MVGDEKSTIGQQKIIGETIDDHIKVNNQALQQETPENETI